MLMISRVKYSALKLLLIVLLLALCGCSSSATPQTNPPTLTPLAFSLPAEALRRPPASAALPLNIASCLFVDGEGARLLDGLSMSVGAAPQPLTETAAQIWIDQAALAQLDDRMLQLGGVRYAVVLAHGRIEGPGSFGPEGRYHYRLRDAQIEPIAPLETTLSELLRRENARKELFVRVTGAVLVGERSAQLVERIGSGGVPGEKASQIELQGALRDSALVQLLQRAPGGQVAFGRVQVEGLWQNGRLFPLVITPLR